MTAEYRLDRANARWMGVCAGFGRMTNIDPFLIRLGFVLLTILSLGPLGLLIYLLIGWLANEG
jgi:phage shock protein C